MKQNVVAFKIFFMLIVLLAGFGILYHLSITYYESFNIKQVFTILLGISLFTAFFYRVENITLKFLLLIYILSIIIPTVGMFVGNTVRYLMIIFLMVTAGLYLFHKQKLKIRNKDFIFVVILIFFVWDFIVISKYFSLKNVQYFSGMLISLIILFFNLSYLVVEEDKILNFYRYVTIIAIPFAIAAFLSLKYQPELGGEKLVELYQEGRAYSIFKNPNLYGRFIFFPITFSFVFMRSKFTIKRLAVFVFLLISGIISFSRGFFVCTTIFFITFYIIYFLVNKRLKKFDYLILLTSILIGIGLQLNKQYIAKELHRTSFLTGRGKIWKKMIFFINREPIFGYGHGEESFRIEKSMEYGFTYKGAPHSTYIRIALNMGYVGLAIYLLLLFSIFLKSLFFIKTTKDPTKRDVVIGLLGTLLGSMVYQTVERYMPFGLSVDSLSFTLTLGFLYSYVTLQTLKKREVFSASL